MSAQEEVQVLPVLTVRNTVLFPFTLMPLSVARGRSTAAVRAAATSEDKELVVVAQRNAAEEKPGASDLFTVGTRGIIKKMSRGAGGQIDMVVQGMDRVVLLKFDQQDPYLKARIRLLPFPEDQSPEAEALVRAVKDLAKRAISMSHAQNADEVAELLLPKDPMRLVYTIGGLLSMEVEKEQALLEIQTRVEALRLIHGYLSHEIQVLELRNKIATDVQTEMTKEQREHLLRRQMQAIQQELGEQNPEQADANLLEERLRNADLPEDARKEAERELGRLRKLPAMAPDYYVMRSYLEFILELPWNKTTEDVLDIPRARQILDEDHYDLKEVKERILEQLGVLKLNPGAKAPILCFVGAPGVGKTSLGQSIARATGRKFERMSLGGLHDEAELRGHRRTYIGAMPGRIIKAIHRAGVNNPVLMLDEVDKLGRDFRGDPSSALLEILDPEQNKNFRDNYLDLNFDLSHVFFIATANQLETIPAPLLDRMEILRLAGYTEEEKMAISRRYLIPRQLTETGLTPERFAIDDEALRQVISRYTREAGVRQLERAIGRLARKAALQFAEGQNQPVQVKTSDLSELLGPERFFPERARKELPPGVATGLAWTESGGDVLYIEATLLPDGKGLTLTGQLGEVMQESARAAYSYLWSHAARFGFDPSLFRNSGVHIHVPAGAIPKDGPSAGVTMAAALASLVSGNPARQDTAMTGEITLTGLVLPVGGIKEKVLAARRSGLRRVILPKDNQKDLRELPEEARRDTEFVFAETIEDVLAAAVPELTPVS